MIGINWYYLYIVLEIDIKMKLDFCKIYKIIFLLFLTNTTNLFAHNLINGGCKDHCAQNVKAIINESKSNIIDYQTDIESKNSCLNKSLCRG